jgi:hypothetical protein
LIFPFFPLSKKMYILVSIYCRFSILVNIFSFLYCTRLIPYFKVSLSQLVLQQRKEDNIHSKWINPIIKSYPAWWSYIISRYLLAQFEFAVLCLQFIENNVVSLITMQGKILLLDLFICYVYCPPFFVVKPIKPINMKSNVCNSLN